MIINSNTVQKEYIGFSQFFFKKNISVKKVGIPFFVLLIFIFAMFSVSKGFVSNDYSKDLFVADFRTDVNKLWEASKIIESKRINNSNLNLREFGTTGKVLNSDEINQNLKRVLINIADIDGDNKLSEDEIQSLGIMSLNEDIYSKELKILQFYRLSIDNNLKHYVVITKGEFAGIVLYNGCMQFIDSNKRCYFGVELFEQL